MSTARVALSPVYKESLNFPGRVSGQRDPWSRESILIYLTVAGSVIPMRILESDSIASVKLRIQTHKGFFVRKQKLVFEGKELARKDTCVRDYGVTEGNVLHLILRFSDLQAITVRTICGKEFKFNIERKRNIGYVKQQVAKRGKGFLDFKDQELMCDGEELEDQRLIDDVCKSNDAVIHLVVRKSAKISVKPVGKNFEVSIVASNLDERDANRVDGGQDECGTESKQLEVVPGKPLQRDFLLEPLIVNPNIELPLVIKQLIKSTFDGLDRGNQPIRSSEGSGGAYFMQDLFGQVYMSVFKPIDEEPMAVNNPRGLPLSTDGEGMKKGTRVGEGALREVAAYLLDHPRSGPRSFSNEDKGFAGVPPTVMIKCLHRGFNYPDGYECASKNIKIGSLQMFMKNCGSCEDMGPAAFPVDEIHKISVLDIRLANADRHAGNILVQRDGEGGEIVLIPIDHGYCLPNNVSLPFFSFLQYMLFRIVYDAILSDSLSHLEYENAVFA
ncbi:phosphatidylinositol 4-kinase gamma-like protein [Actinidia rufa]|uniref:1-phosphatidylinositol 4-kinase n=1 Tax=Actinidia rufa TaxID=165716 RepID=A0A7J0E6L2_9ERIC|nr:phosphatidylinositol 4-kinase gamma-like protein [Actinidia rufa]